MIKYNYKYMKIILIEKRPVRLGISITYLNATVACAPTKNIF